MDRIYAGCANPHLHCSVAGSGPPPSGAAQLIGAAVFVKKNGLHPPSIFAVARHSRGREGAAGQRVGGCETDRAA